MKLHPSPEWEILLEPFRDLFTKPGYRHFCAFVIAFAHLDRRLHVTAVILSGLAPKRHFTSVYRFLRDVAFREMEPWGRPGFWKQKYTTDGYVVWGAPQVDETALEAAIQQQLIGSPNQLAAITAGMTKQPASFVDPG